MSDLAGYLDAFGSPIKVKGFEYLAILEDDYNQVDLGTIQVASNAPQLLIRRTDIATMQLARGDGVDVFDPVMGTWSSYQVRSEPQHRTDGFALVFLLEAT